MAKTILGIDIGQDLLKLALVRGDKVLKTAVVSMPEHLLQEGHIISRESMAELLRTTIKEHGLRSGAAALVLPTNATYVKNVEMPLMTEEQLAYNLPFEFNDYITGDVRDYLFDYAVQNGSMAETQKKTAKTKDKTAEAEKETETENQHLELMIVCTPRFMLDDAHEFIRKAGMKLTMAAPAICSYISLIRARQEFLSQIGEEYGILDLGYNEIRMYMFHKDRNVATRVLEIGLSTLDNVISDVLSIDVHLAHTYLMTNYDNCQTREECMTAYENIAVELMRALNFYRFSSPDSSLSDLWLCGGGAVIAPLAETISGMLDIQLHPAQELIPGGEQIPDCHCFVQAIGMAMA